LIEEEYKYQTIRYKGFSGLCYQLSFQLNDWLGYFELAGGNMQIQAYCIYQKKEKKRKKKGRR
jgi:hypothetical protein